MAAFTNSAFVACFGINLPNRRRLSLWQVISVDYLGDSDIFAGGATPAMRYKISTKIGEFENDLRLCNSAIPSPSRFALAHQETAGSAT